MRCTLVALHHGGARAEAVCLLAVRGAGATRVLHSTRPPSARGKMIEKRYFDELADRIAQALRDSPAHDFEKNLRALLLAFFDRLDLVTREDFEVQKKLLERAQAKLAALEARLAELESHRSSGSVR